jgi:methylenetetrahydrofolate dehydrogenase (NAD+)
VKRSVLPAPSSLFPANAHNSGFAFELRTLDKDALEDAILAANVDDAVDGIIIYFPVFGTLQDSYLQQLTVPTKDVEGLSHKYLFNMYQNKRFLDVAKRQKSLLPCTPLAIIKILEHIGVYNSILPYGNRLFGRTITVVNRSEIVGRPLAALLANDGADVWSVDITGVQRFSRGEGIKRSMHHVQDVTETLEDVVPRSDVVITGVPSKGYKFPVHLLKQGAVCINFSSDKVGYRPPPPLRVGNGSLIGRRTLTQRLRSAQVSTSPLLERSLSPFCCGIFW